MRLLVVLLLLLSLMACCIGGREGEGLRVIRLRIKGSKGSGAVITFLIIIQI